MKIKIAQLVSVLIVRMDQMRKSLKIKKLEPPSSMEKTKRVCRNLELLLVPISPSDCSKRWNSAP